MSCLASLGLFSALPFWILLVLGALGSSVDSLSGEGAVGGDGDAEVHSQLLDDGVGVCVGYRFQQRNQPLQDGEITGLHLNSSSQQHSHQPHGHAQGLGLHHALCLLGHAGTGSLQCCCHEVHNLSDVNEDLLRHRLTQNRHQLQDSQLPLLAFHQLGLVLL